MEAIPNAIIVYGIIQAVVFLTPVLLIAYRQGRKDQEIARMKIDLDGLGEKVSNTIAKKEHALQALSEKIAKLDKDVGQIDTKLEFIKEAFADLKKARA